MTRLPTDLDTMETTELRKLAKTYGFMLAVGYECEGFISRDEGWRPGRLLEVDTTEQDKPYLVYGSGWVSKIRIPIQGAWQRGPVSPTTEATASSSSAQEVEATGMAAHDRPSPRQATQFTDAHGTPLWLVGLRTEARVVPPTTRTAEGKKTPIYMIYPASAVTIWLGLSEELERLSLIKLLTSYRDDCWFEGQGGVRLLNAAELQNPALKRYMIINSQVGASRRRQITLTKQAMRLRSSSLYREFKRRQREARTQKGLDSFIARDNTLMFVLGRIDEHGTFLLSPGTDSVICYDMNSIRQIVKNHDRYLFECGPSNKEYRTVIDNNAALSQQALKPEIAVNLTLFYLSNDPSTWSGAAALDVVQFGQRSEARDAWRQSPEFVDFLDAVNQDLYHLYKIRGVGSGYEGDLVEFKTADLTPAPLHIFKARSGQTVYAETAVLSLKISHPDLTSVKMQPPAGGEQPDVDSADFQEFRTKLLEQFRTECADVWKFLEREGFEDFVEILKSADMDLFREDANALPTNIGTLADPDYSDDDTLKGIGMTTEQLEELRIKATKALTVVRAVDAAVSAFSSGRVATDDKVVLSGENNPRLPSPVINTQLDRFMINATEMISGRKYASLSQEEKEDVRVPGRMAKLSGRQGGGNNWVFFDKHAPSAPDGLRYTLRLPGRADAALYYSWLGVMDDAVKSELADAGARPSASRWDSRRGQASFRQWTRMRVVNPTEGVAEENKARVEVLTRDASLRWGLELVVRSLNQVADRLSAAPEDASDTLDGAVARIYAAAKINWRVIVSMKLGHVQGSPPPDFHDYTGEIIGFSLGACQIEQVSVSADESLRHGPAASVRIKFANPTHRIRMSELLDVHAPNPEAGRLSNAMSEMRLLDVAAPSAERMREVRMRVKIALASFYRAARLKWSQNWARLLSKASNSTLLARGEDALQSRDGRIQGLLPRKFSVSDRGMNNIRETMYAGVTINDEGMYAWVDVRQLRTLMILHKAGIRLFYLSETQTLTHTISYQNYLGKANYVSTNHCQQGSTKLAYEICICEGEQCVVTNSEVDLTVLHKYLLEGDILVRTSFGQRGEFAVGSEIIYTDPNTGAERKGVVLEIADDRDQPLSYTIRLNRLMEAGILTSPRVENVESDQLRPFVEHSAAEEKGEERELREEKRAL